MNNMAYLRGIMDGDGYVNRVNANPRLELSVTSKDFATAFSNTLVMANLTPRWVERDRMYNFNGYKWSSHYYIVRATCKELFVQDLMNLDILSDENKLSYLIGFFQAEGCFRIQKYPDRQCWNWHITNKDLSKLRAIRSILDTLGIKSGLITKKDGISMLYVQRRTDILKLFELGVTKK